MDKASGLSGQAFLGQLSMSLIEGLEKDYGDDFEINVAAIIVDVSWKDENDDYHAQINYKSSDPRRWIQEALFHKCEQIARKGS